ncbi:hypothetical protein HK103_005694 [Boothiomyces macroporosus]|uniref:Uncharacterized protein n=1 Tax=Boothiomyces macroporosus TaxID=261099 RepID=A0AAD5UHP5_9FUNG|nr:hypothetical protein HK103_005694 [Boothiomyces macroporosus]
MLQLQKWKDHAIKNIIREIDTIHPSNIQLFDLTVHPASLGSKLKIPEFPLQNIGEPIKPCRHLALFPSRIPEPLLASDGYDNNWCPPEPFTKRMWGGGRLEFTKNKLRIGQTVEMNTRLASIDFKEGSRGGSVFTQMVKEVTNENGLSMVENRTLVYLEKPVSGSRIVKRGLSPDFTETVKPTPISLFRFSALTFNSHMIHYDKDYANFEGYPSTLVHGPFSLTLLIDCFGRHSNTAVINGIDLNQCTESPTMNFGTGFQGSANAQEFRFKPLNENTFSGQSTALNGNIIAKFLCDRVNDKCKASADVVQLCRGKATSDFAAAFAAAGGKNGDAVRGVAADVWNAVWGLKTDFAAFAKGQTPAAPQNVNAGNSNAGSNTQTNNNQNNNNAQSNGNAQSSGSNGAVVTVTQIVTVDCQATPGAASNNQQLAAVQNSGQCPAGSSFAVSPQCKDAKTSTSPQGGPQFALFDKRCKGTQNTTSKSDKDELCCTGCSDGVLCRAPDALKGIQTCRDGTAPDFSSGSLKFVKKAVSPASCGAANFSKPECGGAKGGV